MQNGNPFEKNRIRDRMRERLILSAFIVLSALASVILMDLIVYPIALLSMRRRELFNAAVGYSFWIVVLSLLLCSLARGVCRLRRDGFGTGQILARIGRRSLGILVSALALLATGAVVIGVIYFIMSNNYYLLYKLTGL
jgi:hypothetical protein